MNILISTIAFKDSHAGVFSRSFNLSRGLVREGHDVTLLTAENRLGVAYKREFREGVLIVSVPSLMSYRISKFGYGILPFLVKLVYIIFRNYDIVHADQHRPASFGVGYVYRLFHKSSRLICDWQDVFGKTGIYKDKSKLWKCSLGPVDNWLETISIKKSDGIIPLSEELFEKACKLRFDCQNVNIVWGGSDIDKIKFELSPKTWRTRFNIPKDEFIIGFVGLEKLDFIKSHKLYQAIRSLRESGIKLSVVRTGRPYDDEFKSKYNIGEEIIEVGYISDVEYGKFLSCADVFMLVQEDNINNLCRWPNVVGDYIAAGRPIITNPLGELVGLQSAFPQSILPIISEETSSDEIKTQLRSILLNKSVFERNYSVIADYAISTFSWDRRAGELSVFYQSLK